MDCPDIDRLIDSLRNGPTDVELAAHVRYCRTCQEDLRLLRAVQAEFQSEPEVPEELVERTLAAIPFPESRTGTADTVSLKHVIVAGVLGASTAGLTVVASDLSDAGSPFHFFVFVTLAGVGAAVAEIRAETSSRKARASA